MKKDLPTRILKFLASLKLAVIIILAIGVLSAWGTIVEAQYNSRIATKVVYHSIYMVVTMAALVINLIAVIVDRYPWKRHHLGFILAHIGIIILIIGSVVTYQQGLDGSMRLAIGGGSRHVMLPQTDIVVWATFDGDRWVKTYEDEVDFYMKRPTPEKPFVIKAPKGEVKVTGYIPFAFEERKLAASEEKDAGLALRFQLQNANINMSQWIQMPKRKGPPSVLNLGPARVVLHTGDYKPSGENEIVLFPSKKDPKKLDYQVYTKRLEKVTATGKIGSGDVIETGWMGLKFRALKYIPRAKEEVKFIPRDRPTEITRAAIQLEYKGEKHWLGKDSLLKFFTDSSAFIVSYGGRRVDVGFELKLEKFNVGRYQGTRRAASYASDVMVPEVGKVNISMNEPLKYKGYTFYQASFSEDEETGEPDASILSVNKDPGRWLKYLGSALIVLGCIVMFYFKRAFRKKRKS